MATTRKTGANRQTDISEIGLLANGSAGGWDVAIDETTSGSGHWFAHIEGPSATFYFEIPGVEIVGQIIEFLENPVTSSSLPLQIGKNKENPIALIKDDEFEDRFFIAVGPADRPLVRFVVAGPDASQFADALRQIREDVGGAEG